MKIPSAFFLLMVITTATVRAATTDIPLFSKRAETVLFARKLISSQAIPVEIVDAAVLKDPFHPIAPAPVASPSNPPTPLSEPSVGASLEQIASVVTPSGSIEIGGEAILLFGQKRFKVGQHLPIVFEGKPYELEIVGIHSTSFTLRLNGVEITKPIKSVTKP